MKYTTTRIGTVGSIVITTGLLAAGGVAAACPLYGNDQSSARDTAYASSWSGNQWSHENDASWSSTNYRMSSSWGEWNPSTYSDNGGSFNGWYSGMMNQMSSYSANWSSSSTSSWAPSGNNWQQSWSNWNPMVWESNGSSYSNWQTQFMSYMNSHMSSFQDAFGA